MVTRSLCLSALLCLSACRDAGVESLAAAKARYAALISKTTPLESKDYDELLASLKAIPSSSKVNAEAVAMATAIEHARAGRVRAPLSRAQPEAVPTLPSLEALRDELLATRKECAALAAGLGTLKDAARAARYELLDACQRRAVTLDDELLHAEQNEAEGSHARPGADGGAR